MNLPHHAGLFVFHFTLAPFSVSAEQRNRNAPHSFADQNPREFTTKPLAESEKLYRKFYRFIIDVFFCEPPHFFSSFCEFIKPGCCSSLGGRKPNISFTTPSILF